MWRCHWSPKCTAKSCRKYTGIRESLASSQQQRGGQIPMSVTQSPVPHTQHKGTLKFWTYRASKVGRIWGNGSVQIAAVQVSEYSGEASALDPGVLAALTSQTADVDSFPSPAPTADTLYLGFTHWSPVYFSTLPNINTTHNGVPADKNFCFYDCKCWHFIILLNSLLFYLLNY